jgi:hypothetical protein
VGVCFWRFGGGQRFWEQREAGRQPQSWQRRRACPSSQRAVHAAAPPLPPAAARAPQLALLLLRLLLAAARGAPPLQLRLRVPDCLQQLQLWAGCEAAQRRAAGSARWCVAMLHACTHKGPGLLRRRATRCGCPAPSRAAPQPRCCPQRPTCFCSITRSSLDASAALAAALHGAVMIWGHDRSIGARRGRAGRVRRPPGLPLLPTAAAAPPLPPLPPRGPPRGRGPGPPRHPHTAASRRPARPSPTP